MCMDNMTEHTVNAQINQKQTDFDFFGYFGSIIFLYDSIRFSPVTSTTIYRFISSSCLIYSLHNLAQHYQTKVGIVFAELFNLVAYLLCDVRKH